MSTEMAAVTHRSFTGTDMRACGGVKAAGQAVGYGFASRFCRSARTVSQSVSIRNDSPFPTACR